MPQWPHAMPELLLLGCDGIHVSAVVSLTPVTRMIILVSAALLTFGSGRFHIGPSYLA